MGNWALLFPSKYLSAADIGASPVTLKIAQVVRAEIDATEEVNGRTVESKQLKGLMSFEGFAKQYVLTKAVGHALAMMFGEETKGWAGHAVTLYTPVEKWFNEDKPRIRVKGSPELKAPMEKRIKLGRKKYLISLVHTAAGGAKPVAPTPSPDQVTDL